MRCLQKKNDVWKLSYWNGGSKVQIISQSIEGVHNIYNVPDPRMSRNTVALPSEGFLCAPG